MGSSLTFLAGSLELRSFHASPLMSSLWVFIAAGLPMQKVTVPPAGTISIPGCQAPHSLAASEGPAKKGCRSPSCFTDRKGSERHMTSVIVEDTVDAPPHMPWAHLSSPAAVSSVLAAPLLEFSPLSPLPASLLWARAPSSKGTTGTCSTQAGAAEEGQGRGRR